MDFIEEYNLSLKTVVKLNNKTETMIFDKSLEVTTIGPYACQNCLVKTLNMSNTEIKYIQYGAFWDCNQLTNVIFPNTLLHIGDNSFLRAAFTEITIPESVLVMSGFAWNQISTVQRFIVDSKNTNFSSEKGFLFNFDKTILLRAPSTLKSITEIPRLSTLTTLGQYCFTSTLLTTFEAPENINSIGTRVFHSMKYIETIDLSYTQIKSIPNMAFQSCSKLLSVKLPFVLETLNSQSFSDNHVLKRIYIYPFIKQINESVFEQCSALKYIFFFGKNDFSGIEMCKGTTPKDSIIVFVTNEYIFNDFGNMKLKQLLTEFTCKQIFYRISHIFLGSSLFLSK